LPCLKYWPILTDCYECVVIKNFEVT